MRRFQTIISCEYLAKCLSHADLRIVDCRFQLGDTEWGKSEYQISHIPSSIYMHLDVDLSGRILPGKTGRHPLPDIKYFSKRLGEAGIGNHHQVVIYDTSHGGIAARLWWMMHALGHQETAVLDGGWKRWVDLGLPRETEITRHTAEKFSHQVTQWPVYSAEEVMQTMDTKEILLVDARTNERYKGVEEPIDPVSGHIPGAINRPFLENIGASGLWKSPDTLRKEWERVLTGKQGEEVVFYCGSGVTACHNVLALKHANMASPIIYAGSWSDWITDPSRPVTS